MKYLFILNDAPYGTERSYNGLRLARELLKDSPGGNEASVFLIGDAVSCAHAGQKVPQGYYNTETMLQGLTQHGANIGVCGSCMDARGIAVPELVSGCRRSSMVELAAWAGAADKVIVF